MVPKTIEYFVLKISICLLRQHHVLYPIRIIPTTLNIEHLIDMTTNTGLQFLYFTSNKNSTLI